MKIFVIFLFLNRNFLFLALTLLKSVRVDFVFLKNNEMKSENIVGDLTFGSTQKIDDITMHTSFMYYNGGFPSIPEGANYVAFSDFIDRATLKVADERLTITFG